MEKFIEVVDVRLNKKVSINTKQIEFFQESDEKDIVGAEIHTITKYIPTKESYEQIQQMLGIEPSALDMIANEIVNTKITEKQKRLLLKLSHIYSYLAEECINDENFDNYLAEYTHLIPMALEDLSAEWRAVAEPALVGQKFNPEYIEVAVGKQDENDWFVQTTDKKLDTYLSVSIAEGLQSKEEAMKVAREFAEKHGLVIVEWD